LAARIEPSKSFDRRDTAAVLDTSRVVDDSRSLRAGRGELEEHTTLLGDGRRVLLPPPERHLNHSCDPNAYLRTVGDELRVVARRPIEAGEEVTVDYLINTHGGSRWRCRCGAERCRGLLEASLFDLPLELQREYRPLLEEWFVERPAERVESIQGCRRELTPELDWLGNHSTGESVPLVTP